MSRRVVIQQTSRAWKKVDSLQSYYVVRCFATTSSSQAGTMTTVRTSTTRESKEARKRDGKLRHAINLYHLTDFFFPTTGESTPTSSRFSSPKSSADEKDQKETASKDFDKSLDDHIRSSIMGSNTTTSSANNFDSNVILQGAHRILSTKKQEDEKNSTSIFEDSSKSGSSITSLSKQVFPLPKTSIDHNKSKVHANEDALPPLPPIDDQEAVRKYIADNVRRNAARMSRAERETGSLHNVDVRGAQVVDALYGTVSAKYPGLEVLRERIKDKEQREMKRQEAISKEELQK